MVWMRDPWHFDGGLIVLEKPSGPGDISKIGFTHAGFWIQFFNIPFMCMNRRMARMMAEILGTVVEIPAESKDCWGRFLRVKVASGVTKLFRRAVKMRLEEFNMTVVAPSRYERLPDFCFTCGEISYSLCDCYNDEAKKRALKGEYTKYGSWL
ncbi:hypothetical protein ACOSQ2_005909 [Xanthoceras sorbifolium]